MFSINHFLTGLRLPSHSTNGPRHSSSNNLRGLDKSVFVLERQPPREWHRLQVGRAYCPSLQGLSLSPISGGDHYLVMASEGSTQWENGDRDCHTKHQASGMTRAEITVSLPSTTQEIAQTRAGSTENIIAGYHRDSVGKSGMMPMARRSPFGPRPGPGAMPPPHPLSSCRLDILWSCRVHLLASSLANCRSGPQAAQPLMALSLRLALLTVQDPFKFHSSCCFVMAS
jgi:hypothetical protein